MYLQQKELYSSNGTVLNMNLLNFFASPPLPFTLLIVVVVDRVDGQVTMVINNVNDWKFSFFFLVFGVVFFFPIVAFRMEN